MIDLVLERRQAEGRPPQGAERSAGGLCSSADQAVANQVPMTVGDGGGLPAPGCPAVRPRTRCAPRPRVLSPCRWIFGLGQHGLAIPVRSNVNLSGRLVPTSPSSTSTRPIRRNVAPPRYGMGRPRQPEYSLTAAAARLHRAGARDTPPIRPSGTDGARTSLSVRTRPRSGCR